MKYRSIPELANISFVFPVRESTTPQKLSVSQRLAVWAALLERAGGTLRLLRDTEYRPEHERNQLREANSPLAIAFADPLLRSQGLASDMYGDGRRFFALSHSSFHKIVCHCLYTTGATAPAEEVSARVSRVAAQANRIERVATHLNISVTGMITNLLIKSYV